MEGEKNDSPFSFVLKIRHNYRAILCDSHYFFLRFPSFFHGQVSRGNVEGPVAAVQRQVLPDEGRTTADLASDVHPQHRATRDVAHERSLSFQPTTYGCLLSFQPATYGCLLSFGPTDPGLPLSFRPTAFAGQRRRRRWEQRHENHDRARTDADRPVLVHIQVVAAVVRGQHQPRRAPGGDPQRVHAATHGQHQRRLAAGLPGSGRHRHTADDRQRGSLGAGSARQPSVLVRDQRPFQEQVHQAQAVRLLRPVVRRRYVASVRLYSVHMHSVFFVFI